MNESFLELRNITFGYPKSDYKIFNDLSFELSNEHHIIGLIGSNGSGKTALARILTGLVKVQSGKVYLFGSDITKLRTTKKLDKISLSFQMMNNAFITSSVKDEISYNLQLKEKISGEKIEKNNLISFQNEFYNTKKDQHPLTLSGGEKRKLSFELLRILDPDMYILDEPTLGLDFYGIKDLESEIYNLKEQKKKVLIISHDLSMLLKVTDSIIILGKDEESKNSLITYQGSLEKYLIENFDQAQEFLNIPIEFNLYYQDLQKNAENSYKSYLEFLKYD